MMIKNTLYAGCRKNAFTLVELLATIAIVAVLSIMAGFFTVSYVGWARNTADQRTLLVLNDALNRYKTEGGSLAALTVGTPPADVESLLHSTLNWNGLSHNVMQSTQTYPGQSLSATGTGSSYQFTRFNSYTSISGGVSPPSHTSVSFTTTGTSSWTVPQGLTSVEVLVVAGGGGGGDYGAGGGGAGGLIHQTGYSVTPGNSITVTIGAGGNGGINAGGGHGSNGANSVFGTLTAIGGGGGGTQSGGNLTGSSGGSGGGGSLTGGSGGAGTASQGNAGGNSTGGAIDGGGGGGAGAAGGPGGAGINVGGVGLQFSISGTPTYYAGGGGGTGWSGGAAGGSGGGGSGVGGGTNGTANTGGGGGACGGTTNGGSGGSGIVILKY